MREKTPHILIVDDDAALLQALPQAVYLRIEGVQVDTSDSALEALKLIQKHDYDAIVTDIKMPGMDGLALLEKIQQLRPDTPTLLITGHGDHNLAIQALRGGAYDFIQKPIDRDYFLAALNRAIDTHQLRSEVRRQQLALEQYAASLEKQVQERTRELVAANAAKDEFIGVVSHELKTPLTSLKGMIQILQRRQKRTGEQALPELNNMERSVRRMEIIVQDLLNTSLIERGLFVLNCERYDLNVLCQSVLDEHTVQRDPSLFLELAPQPVEADVDMNRLSQVLLNLLSNARKYSPPGAPVTIRVERKKKHGIISIIDKGTGIPPETIPRIFERFYRAPGVEVQSGSSIGVGLGLYVAQKIVEQHGGRIEVQSTPGEGSTFSLLLPLARPVSSEDQESTGATGVLGHPHTL